MDTKQANAVITRNLKSIERAVANALGNHWSMAQGPDARTETVSEVVQGAVVHLLSYSLPRFDASKATKSGDAALDQFVKSAAVNYAKNWRKAIVNRPTDSVDTIGASGSDKASGEVGPGRQTSVFDAQVPAGNAELSAGSTPSEAFASLSRAQDHAALLAAIERIDGLDRELLDGLVAGEAKQDIAHRLDRSPAWVTIRLKALRRKLAA